MQKNEKGNILTVKPDGLTIIWGGPASNGRYWHKATDFVELIAVTWLEVKCSLPLSFLSANTQYELSFSLKFKEESQGWNTHPVIFCVRVPGQKTIYKRVDLSKEIATSGNDWIDLPKGLVFKIENTKENEKLDFGMYEIENDQWKKGLMIQSVKIKPVK
ncbi:protein PHLOEM PROTEIN 2-LIKE A9-like [Aristolochia californica]|uniref:protein PHLOEM PROTEIN 2-LIKE A9-like n=1 Tax=Aristolochia californica TaxID=171875 RepID=UPI0035D6E4AB